MVTFSMTVKTVMLTCHQSKVRQRANSWHVSFTLKRLAVIYDISLPRSRKIKETDNLFVLDPHHTAEKPILLRLHCISNHSKLFKNTLCDPKLVEIVSDLVRLILNLCVQLLIHNNTRKWLIILFRGAWASIPNCFVSHYWKCKWMYFFKTRWTLRASL